MGRSLVSANEVPSSWDGCESAPDLEFELGRSRPDAAAARTLALRRLQHGSVQRYPVWHSNPHVFEDNGS